MHHSHLPRVRDGALRFTRSAAEEQTSVLVGEAEWYEMLAQIDSFSFEDQNGRSFTARRERRDQQWYWYAYRKHDKKLHKIYLGKVEQLELARLQTAACQLADLPREAQLTSSADPLSVEQGSDVLLRSTKLRIPAVPANLLQRPRLTEQLRRPPRNALAVSPRHRRTQALLTVMTAPAGYGKSTLLAEWLDQIANCRLQIADYELEQTNLQSAIYNLQSIKVAWLSLDSEDNDLLQFWRYVVAAFQMSVPELGRQALMLLQKPQPPAIDNAVTALLDDLHHTPRALVLVLDDYHLIDTPAIHDSLATFLTHCPAHLHVVI